MAGFMDAINKSASSPKQGEGMEREDEAPEAQGEPATEEEEQLLDTWMQAWADVAYSDNGGPNPMVLDNLRGDFDQRALAAFQQAEPPLKTDDPKDAIAATAVLLLVLVDSKLGYQQKANAEAPGNEQEDGEEAPSYSAVLMQAGKTSVEMLADLAESIGVADLDEDEMAYVWMRASDLYRYASPNIDQKAMQVALSDMELAARQGKIPGMPKGEEQGKVLPGLPGGPAMQQEA